MNDNITIFDKILEGNIPCKKVYEDEYVLAFHDTEPQAPTHVLVIPKKKITSVMQAFDWDPEDWGHFFRGICNTAKSLGLEENGYRVVMNNGKDAMQTVAYLHAHVLAGRKFKWPPG